MKMKRVLFSLLFLCAIMPVSLANAQTGEDVKLVTNNGVSITESDYERLIGLGFTGNEIENMDQEEYDLNEGMTGEVVSADTKYYKVFEPAETEQNKTKSFTSTSTSTTTTEQDEPVELTKEQYYKELNNIKDEQTSADRIEIQASDTGTTSYKTMTTSIVSLGSREYRVKNSVKWDKIPKTRSHDVIGAAINSAVFRPQNTGNYGRQNWTLYNSYYGKYKYDGATYTATSDKWSKKDNGYGVKMNLKNNEVGSDFRFSYNVVSLSMYAYYEVNELVYGSQTYLDAYGRYAHAQQSLSGSFGFSMGLGGPGISFSGVSSSYFSIQENTQATQKLY